jgi:hypothetical protein
MRVVLVSLLSLALAANAFSNSASAQKKKQPEADPVTWGMLSQSAACVIFKESRKKDTKFYGVAQTQRTYSVLDVIETQHYDVVQRHFTEDQPTLDQLQRDAMNEHITFVKIQEGYSPALLDKARAICTNAMGPAHSTESAGPLPRG